MESTTFVAALFIATGIVGLIVPVLPGLLCVVLGVLVWALGHSGSVTWTVFGLCCAVAAAGYAVQILVSGRQLTRAGIPRRSSLVGVAVGIVGFFVIPVVGLFIGFVLGVYAAEHARLRDSATAWRDEGGHPRGRHVRRHRTRGSCHHRRRVGRCRRLDGVMTRRNDDGWNDDSVTSLGSHADDAPSAPPCAP